MRSSYGQVMDETLRTWGANLRRFREAFGKSQDEVAAELEVAQATIARWEAGRMEPRRQMKVRLAEYYCTDVAILFPLTRAVA